MISHHSADAFVAEQIRARLCMHGSQPQARTFEVLLDTTTLGPGDTWQTEIDEWLGRFHLFILVVSRTALERPWVTYEVFNAAHRVRFLNRSRSSGPFFRFVSVVLDGLDPAVLNEPRLAPARLTEFQALPCDRADPDCAGLVQLLEQMRRAFELRESRPVVDALLPVLEGAHWLRERLVQELPISAELPRYLSPFDLNLSIADHLLEVSLDRLFTLVRKFARADPVVWRRVLRLVFPHAFVDEAPARALREHVGMPLLPRREPVSLKAEKCETPEHYVRKAFGDPEPLVLHCATTCTAKSPLSDLRRAINVALVVKVVQSDGELAQALLSPGEPESRLKDVRRVLEAWIADWKQPVVMTLPPSLSQLDEPTIEQLVIDYEPMLFFLRTEENREVVAQRFPKVLSLPDLPPGYEAEAIKELLEVEAELEERRKKRQ
jgi:hypothetical protein